MFSQGYIIFCVLHPTSLPSVCLSVGQWVLTSVRWFVSRTVLCNACQRSRSRGQIFEFFHCISFLNYISYISQQTLTYWYKHTQERCYFVNSILFEHLLLHVCTDLKHFSIIYNLKIKVKVRAVLLVCVHCFILLTLHFISFLPYV